MPTLICANEAAGIANIIAARNAVLMGWVVRIVVLFLIMLSAAGDSIKI